MAIQIVLQLANVESEIYAVVCENDRGYLLSSAAFLRPRPALGATGSSSTSSLTTSGSASAAFFGLDFFGDGSLAAACFDFLGGDCAGSSSGSENAFC